MPNSSKSMASSAKNTKLVTIGSILLVLALGVFGLSLSTIQGPILKSINGESFFTLTTTVASLAICVMTPVGGRLTDMIGTKKLVLWGGLISIATGLLLPLMRTPVLFILDRFVLSIAQGAMASVAYIIVRQVNPPKEVPKVMGYLAAAMAFGAFFGSWLAGVFTDMGLLWAAMIFPVVFVIPAVWLIYTYMPHQETNPSIKLDWIGLILLSICLSAIFLSLNFGPTIGWGDWKIIVGFAAGIVALIALLVYERKAASPLIPLQIFKNKQYSVLLVIAFFSIFYAIAMNVYVPKGVQDLMHASAAVSGSLQIPRTILTVILPAFVGVWITRNQVKHTWMALALGGFFIFCSFSLLVFMGPSMPVWFVIVMLTFTGASDSLRSTALTPAAQTLLAPKDMGIGTSMIGFTITLSNLFSSALYGIAYDSLLKLNENGKGEIYGLDTVFLIAAVTGLICLLIASTIYRKMALSGKYTYKPEQSESPKAKA